MSTCERCGVELRERLPDEPFPFEANPHCDEHTDARCAERLADRLAGAEKDVEDLTEIKGRLEAKLSATLAQLEAAREALEMIASRPPMLSRALAKFALAALREAAPPQGPASPRAGREP